MEPANPSRIRAADADRERVATTVQQAGTEGRLTLEEVEERLTRVYAAKFTDELAALTADLPRPEPPRPGFPLTAAALRRHPALRLQARPSMPSGKKGGENSLTLDLNFAAGPGPDGLRRSRTVPTPGQGNHGLASPARARGTG